MQPEPLQTPINDKKSPLDALMPLFIGMLVDMVDLATLGPIGMAWGWLIGGVGSFVVCSIYNVKLKIKVITSILIGLYCSMPGTSFLPLATVLSVLWKWTRKKQS